MAQETTQQRFERVISPLVDACVNVYGSRLVSVAVFGSVGRGTPRPDSDIDLLIVAEPLPDGRIPRMEEFARVESAMRAVLADARATGLSPTLSPVVRTRAEIELHSPLLLDLVDDARIYVDREHFLRLALDRLRDRLAALGAKRIWRGNAWFWDLKPDYKPGDVFEV